MSTTIKSKIKMEIKNLIQSLVSKPICLDTGRYHILSGTFIISGVIRRDNFDTFDAVYSMRCSPFYNRLYPARQC